MSLAGLARASTSGASARFAATSVAVPAIAGASVARSALQLATPSLGARLGAGAVSAAAAVAGAQNSARGIHVHEYAAQDLMREYGVDVPEGYMASTPEEAEQRAREFESRGSDIVVKAQVLAGGRGKGHFEPSGLQSGVHMCYTAAEAKAAAEGMLGQRLVTLQTGEKGLPCDKVLVAERLYTRRELYFAILLDREMKGPAIVASASGGVNIEEVAATNPEAIFKEAIDAIDGPRPEQLERCAVALGFQGASLEAAVANMGRLYKLFEERDATMIEVNPMAETPDGKVLCMDAKLNFDENALFRQPEVAALRDPTQEDEREVEAAKYDLNYIGLDGSIACMVNGAGLAMATMDIIKLHDGEPANFLDVGGGATETQVEEAFRIISEDPKVEAILVNIFGGIMRCDVIASGIVNAAHNLNLRVPLVVRLQGTNVEEGKLILESSPLRIIALDDLDEAAEHVVKLSKIVRLARDAHVNVSFEMPI